MRGHGRTLFPIGLYASLLAALVALMRPAGAEPFERVVRAGMALPFRAYGGMTAQPIAAASTTRSAVARARTRTFWMRMIEVERRRRPAQVPVELQPSYCRVRGRSAQGTRLVLDRRWKSIDAYADYVTIGDVLLGFLAPRGAADDWVEVMLLGARGRGELAVPRSVAATIDTELGPLNFVVEPAASIDPWPLRCGLIDDPYRAARLHDDGQTVLTASVPDDPVGPVPAGLRIGAFRVWGYQRGDQRLPIGFFVDRPESQGLPLVTLWRRAAAPSPVDGGWRRLPLYAFTLVSDAGRWFASLPFDAAVVPVGASVVRASRLVGSVSSSGPGYAIITPFGELGSRWDTVFVPDEGDARRIVLRVIAADSERVWLRILDAAPPIESRGGLFTSSAEGPAGLWLGDASPAEEHAVVIVTRAEPARAGGLAVLVNQAVDR